MRFLVLASFYLSRTLRRSHGSTWWLVRYALPSYASDFSRRTLKLELDNQQIRLRVIAARLVLRRYNARGMHKVLRYFKIPHITPLFESLFSTHVRVPEDIRRLTFKLVHQQLSEKANAEAHRSSNPLGIKLVRQAASHQRGIDGESGVVH